MNVVRQIDRQDFGDVVWHRGHLFISSNEKILIIIIISLFPSLVEMSLTALLTALSVHVLFEIFFSFALRRVLSAQSIWLSGTLIANDRVAFDGETFKARCS